MTYLKVAITAVSELSEIGPLSQDEVPVIPFDIDIQFEKRKYEERIASLRSEVESLTQEVDKARQQHRKKVDSLQAEMSMLNDENAGALVRNY